MDADSPSTAAFTTSFDPKRSSGEHLIRFGWLSEGAKSAEQAGHSNNSYLKCLYFLITKTSSSLVR